MPPTCPFLHLSKGPVGFEPSSTAPRCHAFAVLATTISEFEIRRFSLTKLRTYYSVINTKPGRIGITRYLLSGTLSLRRQVYSPYLETTRLSYFRLSHAAGLVFVKSILANIPVHPSVFDCHPWIHYSPSAARAALAASTDFRGCRNISRASISLISPSIAFSIAGNAL